MKKVIKRITKIKCTPNNEWETNTNKKEEKEVLRKVIQRTTKAPFIAVDKWKPTSDQIVIEQCKGSIIIQISKMYGTYNPSLDRFDLSIKKSYNNDVVRKHIAHYLNYFINFYDKDRELVMAYGQMKCLIDSMGTAYDKRTFIYDLKRYILNNPLMLYKIQAMNRDNYCLSLNYDNKNTPNLQYNDRHAIVLYEISLKMLIIIPIITHFAYSNKVTDIETFLLEFYSFLFEGYDIDIYSKLMETASSNINRNIQKNPIWNNQDIRSIDSETHAIESVNNIIINVIPKYIYSENLISLNFASIKNIIKYKVTDIGYDYDYIPLSSSKRDEDQNSEFDKFEAGLVKQDESLYLQNEVNCEQSMKRLLMYHKISKEEVDYYTRELKKDSGNVINNFQKQLIFNLFYSSFGDGYSINAINQEDYVKLLIIAKKRLLVNNMVILPYIISGKIMRLVPRKAPNKKEYDRLRMSKYYPKIVDKYRNEKSEKEILSIIGTILASEFQIIDYDMPEITGRIVNTDLADIICEEILMYITLI